MIRWSLLLSASAAVLLAGSLFRTPTLEFSEGSTARSFELPAGAYYADWRVIEDTGYPCYGDLTVGSDSKDVTLISKVFDAWANERDTEVIHLRTSGGYWLSVDTECPHWSVRLQPY